MRLAVVGGGLAGLVVALRRSEAGDEVTVYEACDRLGGQIQTERTHGFVIEHGAEGFVARSAALAELASSLEIQGDLIDQLTLVSYFFDGQGLLALGPGEAAQKLGFQVPNEELGRGIRSFRTGMAGLIDALAREADRRTTLRLGCKAERIAVSGRRYELEIRGTSAEMFDQVVVATSARGAANLLEPWLGSVASALRGSKTLSSVTVSLAYPRLAVDHPLDGSGFIVAEDQQLEGFRACGFVSSKLADRAPRDRVLLRLFFRPEATTLKNDSDADWVARAERCLARALHVTSSSERAWVSRWPSALPVFDVEHTEAVKALEAALGSSSVRLAGAAFHGSGIDAAVRSALRAEAALSGA